MHTVLLIAKGMIVMLIVFGSIVGSAYIFYSPVKQQQPMEMLLSLWGGAAAWVLIGVAVVSAYSISRT